MAERYRKDAGKRVSINCRVTAETKLYLNALAGEFSLGEAIERLVDDHRQRSKKRKSATKAQPQFATIQ